MRFVAGLTRAALVAALLFVSGCARAQTSVVQGATWVQGHVPAYANNGSSQTVIADGGPAGGSGPGAGVREIGLQVPQPPTGNAPWANSGTGPSGANFCDFDGPTTGPNHFICLSPNAGGGGLISYGAQGGASALPLNLVINGTTYQFPFVISGIVGPNTSVINDLACWNNTTGTLLKDCGALSISGGTNISVTGTAPAFTVSVSGLISAANGGTGVNNGSSTVTLAAPLTTTGTGAPTLSFPSTPQTYTFPLNGSSLLSTATATLTAAPSNPTGTANTALTMMGLGSTCKITPVVSTRLLITVTGSAQNSPGDPFAFGVRYGSGTPPANGASATGTALGAATVSAPGNPGVPFSLTGVASGLTVGTQYWIDLGLSASLGGTSTATSVTCVAVEI